MTTHESTDSEPPDRPRTRRAVLGATGTAAAAALAGCHGSSGGSGPEPKITLKDVRVVQTVEDSNLDDGTRRLSDPPIVAGEYATVMFDLDVEHADKLPSTVKLALISGQSNVRQTVQLSRSDIEAIDRGADAPAVFHRTANSSGPGDPPPVFEMPKGIQKITVVAAHTNPNIRSNGVTLTEGPNGDFEVTTVQTLRVGFIPVKDPGSVLGVTHYHGGNVVHFHTTDLDWGDENGEAANYERSVRSSFEFLKRAYPGQVVAYRHDSHMVGHIREITNAATKDAEEALTTLNRIRGRSSFPNGGKILTEDVSKQEAIDLMDADTGGAFDAHVLICPKGTASGNAAYFPAHWGSDPPAGYHYHFNAAVAAHEALAKGDDTSHVHTTAQEIGHRFAQPVYDGKIRRKNKDALHANDDLLSTGYDLTDGSYTLINDWKVPDGKFTPGSVQSSGGNPEVQKYPSYMSYTGKDTWTDSRIHRYLIEGGFQPGYSGGGSPGIAPVGAAGTDAGAIEVERVIQAFGSVQDGVVRFHDSVAYRARPGGNEYDPDRHDAATPVEMTLQGPGGEALASATVPDRHVGSHGETHNAVAVSLPFPTRGVALVADREGRRSRLNPIVDPIRHALVDVPPEPLVEGEATLSGLLEILQQAAEQMMVREYRGAAETLDEQFVPRVRSGVRDYEPYANQPTGEQLKTIAAHMAERLHTVASEAG